MNLLSFLRNLKRNSGLILLNTPIENFSIFKLLWNNALIKIFLDGFGNLIHSKNLEHIFIPDIVLGDFDSIKPEILNHYRKMSSVKVVEDPDQNCTDLDKALKYLIDNYKMIDTVIIHFKSGGRHDHIFAVFNSLCKVKQYSNIPVILISECDVTVVLSPGEHKLIIDKEYAEGTCGLIPLGESVIVSTTGLKWNLDQDELKFGKLISSSNNLSGSSEVFIKCNKNLIWTMTYLNPNNSTIHEL